MTSEGFGEMFEGDTADMCGGKFSLMSMGGQVDGLACADPGARTPFGVTGNLVDLLVIYLLSWVFSLIISHRNVIISKTMDFDC